MSDRLLLFSADCHAGVRTDLYAEYIDADYRDDLEQFMAFEGQRVAKLRVDDDDSESQQALRRDYERRAVYATQLDKRIAALEDDGFVGEVIFPDGGFGNRIPFSAGFGGMSQYSAGHHAAALRAYNRWLGETLTPDRQVGLALIPLVDIPAAVAEVERARSQGLRGVMPQWDGVEQSELFGSGLDAVWAACASEALPVHFHSGSGIPAMLYTGSSRPSKVIGMLENLFWCRRALGQLIMGGVLERHPGLHVVFAETWADWVPRTLSYMDWMWSNMGDTELRSLVPTLPSEYWVRQGHMAAHTPSLIETRMRHEIGLDRMMFGTDFPHSGSPWGVSDEFVRSTIGAAEVPVDEARKLLGENAVKLYDLDHAKLTTIARRVGPTVADVVRPPDPEDRERMPEYIRSKVSRPLSSL